MSDTKNNVYSIYEAPSVVQREFKEHTDQSLELANATAPRNELEQPTYQNYHGEGEAHPQALDITAAEGAEKPKTPARLNKSFGALALYALGTAGLAVFSSLAEEREKPVEQPTVQIEAPEGGTAWDLAGEIKDEDASQREVSDAIQEQADKQLDLGVQPGEMFVLPDEFVSEEAEKQYAPEQPESK